jgi:hypothetical protein
VGPMRTKIANVLRAMRCSNESFGMFHRDRPMTVDRFIQLRWLPVRVQTLLLVHLHVDGDLDVVAYNSSGVFCRKGEI